MRNRLIALIIVVAVTMAAAQNTGRAKHSPGATSPSAYKLISISVKGTKYKPADVIAASGIRVGENVSEENFKRATAKLGDTGLFTNIAYTYSFSSEGTKLELELVDNAELVPVRFDNFAWYADQDLIDKVHTQLGLFEGKVPVSGSLNDQVATVLSGLIGVRNPQLHAVYLQSSSLQSEKIEAVVFSVSGAPIRIRKIEYVGSNPSFGPSLSEVAKKVEGGEYSRSKLGYFAEKDARPVYLQHGYLKASFGIPEPAVVSETKDEVDVDVKLPVTEGMQYKLASVHWSGESALPEAKLQELLHARAGEPVNAVQLDDDLMAARKLYGTKGYLKANVTPEAEFNDSESSVAYVLTVKQGDQYRLGEVDFDGVDDKAKARLREDWHLREGEPYDTSYPARFVKEASRDFPAGVRWNIKAHESINEAEKTVDVTLTFVASGS